MEFARQDRGFLVEENAVVFVHEEHYGGVDKWEIIVILLFRSRFPL